MKNDVRLFIAIVALSFVVTFAIKAAQPDRPVARVIALSLASCVAAFIAAHHLARFRK